VALVALFLVLLVIAALLVAMSPTLSRSLTALFVPTQSGAIPWNGTDPVNIVMVGLDQRTNEFPHTDTMIVASIDPKTDSIRMLSIPRDLWVNIPNYYADRINDAYGFGGTPLLIKTAEGVVNIPIRYYAVINFKGFEKVIDALGGVTINVKYTINDPTFPAPVGNGYAPLYIKAGVHHMDGRLALDFVRTRHQDPLGDLGRNQRQQQLLFALKQQALQPSTLFKIPTVLDALGHAVKTNFPYSDLTYLARVVATAPKSHTKHLGLNYSNNTVSNFTTAGGAEVLLPNWPAIHSISRHLFYDPRLKSAQVEVLNGTGTPGEADSLGQWMRQSGFKVPSVGNADNPNYQHTEVIRNASVDGGDYVARMAADLLQVKVTSRSVPGSHYPVVVIVGADWTNPSQS
jgi:LCP family protein required for cell wall assembly